MNSPGAAVVCAMDLPPRRLLSRARLGKLARFGSAQVVVQVLGFVAGLVIVRTISQTDYGHYTLALTMIGLASILLDLGVMTAVVAVGGAWHAQPARLRAVLGDARHLQRRLALIGLVLVPVFAAVLAAQGLEPASVVALTLLIVACTGLQLRNNMALAVVRLRGHLRLQQVLEVGLNLMKLAMVIGATAIFLDAQMALAINLACAAAMFVILRRHLIGDIGPPGPPSGEFAPEIRRMVKLQAPNAIYQCASGQLAVWLIALLGSAENVAEVGALGRLALFFALIGAVVTAIVQPYFARAESHREIVSAFWATNLFFAALTALLVAAAAFYPGALLWILGPKYSGLTVELVWMVLAACFAAWGGTAYSIGAARGWIVPGFVIIPAGVVTLALSAWLLDVSTVAGSFMLNTAAAAVAAVLSVGYVIFCLRRQANTARTFP